MYASGKLGVGSRIKYSTDHSFSMLVSTKHQKENPFKIHLVFALFRLCKYQRRPRNSIRMMDKESFSPLNYLLSSAWYFRFGVSRVDMIKAWSWWKIHKMKIYILHYEFQEHWPLQNLHISHVWPFSVRLRFRKHTTVRNMSHDIWTFVRPCFEMKNVWSNKRTGSCGLLSLVKLNVC